MPTDIEKTKGEIYIVLSNLIWSCFPVLIVLSYSKLSALISLAWSTIFAAIFFLFLILYHNTWSTIYNKAFLKYAFLLALFNGIIFYSLYYLGLEKTTPNNVSLIGQVEILSSFIFFHLIKKEYISKEHKVGIIFMALGALIVLSHNFLSFNIGDFLILLAILSAPLGNYFQQKARKIVSTEMLLFVRYLITAPFVFLLAYLLGENLLSSMTKESVLFLVLSGVIVFGVSKIFWVEGIHRISVTKANALCCIGPLITMFFSWLLLKQSPTIFQLTSFFPLFIGLLLLTDNLKLSFFIRNQHDKPF